MEPTRLAIKRVAASAFLTMLLLQPASAQTDERNSPPGADKSVTTRLLERGAKTLQGNRPVDTMDIYLSGIHPMKNRPEMQMGPTTSAIKSTKILRSARCSTATPKAPT